MISEIWSQIAGWGWLDTWIVVTGGLAAMACALPGCFLLIRRQSMMGDALSHTVLPGIVLAFLFAAWLRSSEWISGDQHHALLHTFMFFGALVVGVGSAMLTEWVKHHGQVDAGAALGVVFVTLFALGLLLIRVAADSVHIDPDCVLYGVLEAEVLDTVGGVPRAAIVNGVVLLLNIILVHLFYKELKVSAFDPGLATTLGISARWMHYGLMAVTAATLVMAFESVGSILVIAMLIAPAATAYLLTDNLYRMLILSLVIAGGCAILGHVLAIAAPIVVMRPLGFDPSTANTAGAMAAAAGIFFLLAMFFSPAHGVVAKVLSRWSFQRRIAADDVLAAIYRWEEEHANASPATRDWILASVMNVGSGLSARMLQKLVVEGSVSHSPPGYTLTDSGRRRAQQLVRSHRLWEAYMAKHFELPEDHLHEMAEKVEHYLSPDLRSELAAELDAPAEDPHGKQIPPEQNGAAAQD